MKNNMLNSICNNNYNKIKIYVNLSFILDKRMFKYLNNFKPLSSNNCRSMSTKKLKSFNPKKAAKNFFSRSFRKELCISQLSDSPTEWSNQLLNLKFKKVKNVYPAMTSLEIHDPNRLFALKAYLEDLSQKNQNPIITGQLNLLNNILNIEKGKFYFMENGYFYRGVTYFFPYKNGAGRMYNSHSIQRFKKEIRYFLYHDIYKDVDIINAHPSILLTYAEKQKIHAIQLYKLVTDRESFYTDVQRENKNLDMTQVKRLVLITLNLTLKESKKLKQSPTLRALLKEIVEIREDLWLNLTDDSTLMDLLNSEIVKKKPEDKKKVTVQAYTCQASESRLLLKLFDFLKTKDCLDRNIPVSFVPFFDGAFIRFNDVITNKQIENLIAEFNTQQRSPYISFAVKDLKSDFKYLNENTLSKYVNLTRYLQTLNFSTCQKICEKLEVSTQIIPEKTFHSISNNALLNKNASKALEVELKDGYKLSRKINRRLSAIEKGGQEKEENEPFTLNTQLAKISSVIEQNKSLKFKKSKYFLSSDEKNQLKQSVFSEISRIRAALLEHSQTEDSLHQFVDELTSKDDASELYNS